MKAWMIALALFSAGANAQGIEFEIGEANASYEWTGGHYARLSARFGDDKWALGMAHVGEQRFSKCPDGPPEWNCHYAIMQNLYVDVTRYVKIGPYIEFGMGPAISQNRTRTTPELLNFHIQISVRYERWSLGIHHYSNAGTSPTGYNMGQDAVVIGYRF